VSETPFRDRPSADAFLGALALRRDSAWPLATAALALACRNRPRVGLERYHRHLADLATELAAEAGTARSAEERRAALVALISGRYGYRGDRLTYEDLQNANLMRVIDRRKGLPVALGILYLHAARAQGWHAAGLAFPGHFLLRLGEGGASLIVDPFHDGRACDAAALRELLKTIAGDAAELAPAHYAEASDRDVLLRLENNLKLRLLQGRRFSEALDVIEGMLLFAPDEASLWYEAGLVNAECGNLRAAIDALDRALALSGDAARRHHAAALLQQLKARLQ
jgi:regulator of sirC expression with transglutaminase-like and TPR domain